MTHKARPRVLHVITDDAPRGAQRAGGALDAELRLRGWTSAVVALARSAEPDEARLPVEALSGRRSATAALPHLRVAARGFDVVVAHGSSTLPACALSLPRGVPFVYVNIGDLSVWLRTRTRRIRARAVLSRAAAVAAISERSQQFLTERLGLPAGRVHVLPNFRDPDPHLLLDRADRDELRRGLGWPTDRPVALYLGSLTHEKRPDLAARVAALLPEVQVVLAGPGQLSGDAAQAARRAGVLVSGATRNPETALAAADVLLLTSDTEGLPGVLIEAGMAARPAAATSVGFVDEIVLNGITGRLAPPGDVDALAQAVRDCLAHAEEWGAAARQHCLARFSTDSAVPRWERLLLDVSGHPNGQVSGLSTAGGAGRA